MASLRLGWNVSSGGDHITYAKIRSITSFAYIKNIERSIGLYVTYLCSQQERL